MRDKKLRLILITLTLVLIGFSSNAQKKDMLGFTCYYGGTPSNSVIIIDSLVGTSNFQTIKKNLNSRKGSIQFLAIVICEYLVKIEKDSLSESEIKIIKKAYSSKKKISVCSGCTNFDQIELKELLNDKDSWRTITENRYKEMVE